MHGDRFDTSNEILPLKDAVVLAQPHYWDHFPPQLLEHRVTIANSLVELKEAEPSQKLAIIVLDDSDIQTNVVGAWEMDSVSELIVVLPEFSSHDAGLRSLARIDQLSEQLDSFGRSGDLFAIKCTKNIPTEWNILKLLAAIESTTELSGAGEPLDTRSPVKDEVIRYLTTLEELIKLTGSENSAYAKTESPDVASIREENVRLKSNNASLRIQVEALQRKYNTLANSRLGKLTLRRWGRK